MRGAHLSSFGNAIIYMLDEYLKRRFDILLASPPYKGG